MVKDDVFPPWVTIERIEYFFKERRESIQFPEYAGFHYSLRLFYS